MSESGHGFQCPSLAAVGSRSAERALGGAGFDGVSEIAEICAYLSCADVVGDGASLFDTRDDLSAFKDLQMTRDH